MALSFRLRATRDVLLSTLAIMSFFNRLPSSLWRTGVVAISAYFLLPALTSFEPLSMSEVLEAVAAQPTDRLLAAFGIFDDISHKTIGTVFWDI